MAHLTLVGLSADRTRLLLVDDHGLEHTLTADAALRKALRGDYELLGQLEIHMDSALRPRDIQARIRGGESPDAVAQAAQTSVDQIMPYANPVLAERAHLADRAQRASVRRPAGESGARTLGEAVGRHLRELNVSEETASWDAWRREDGRWTLACSFDTSSRKGTATFSFDAPGNFVVPEDDDAKWLIGDAVDKAPRTGSRPTRKRRLSSVSAEELPLGEDAIEMVSDESAVTTSAGSDTLDLTETAAQVSGVEDRAEPEQEVDQQPAAGSGSDTASEQGDQVTDGSDPGDAPAPPRRPVSKKRGRASVPSWDEIMFGGSDQKS